MVGDFKDYTFLRVFFDIVPELGLDDLLVLFSNGIKLRQYKSLGL